MNNELATQLCERIMAAVPRLQIHPTRLVTEGFDSDAVIVNGAWVFRFPRRADAAAQLAVEQALLPALAIRVPIAIPHFKIVVGAGDDSLPFFASRHADAVCYLLFRVWRWYNHTLRALPTTM